MSKFDKTDEQILEELRENSKKQGTVESLVYALLSTAEPHVVENFENQAVAFHKLGLQIGQQMKSAESDPAKKKEWMSLFDRLASGQAAGFNTIKSSEDDK
tara:strand:- start:227 stop:529 length:303 start_codon:yes stop_codon:yes gene_type:complete